MGKETAHSITGLTRDELDCLIGMQSLREMPMQTRLAVYYRFEKAPATLEEASLMCDVSPGRISKAEKKLLDNHKKIRNVYF